MNSKSRTFKRSEFTPEVSKSLVNEWFTRDLWVRYNSDDTVTVSPTEIDNGVFVPVLF